MGLLLLGFWHPIFITVGVDTRAVAALKTTNYSVLRRECELVIFFCTFLGKCWI